jgi:hypothetical protein
LSGKGNRKTAISQLILKTLQLRQTVIYTAASLPGSNIQNQILKKPPSRFYWLLNFLVGEKIIARIFWGKLPGFVVD